MVNNFCPRCYGTRSEVHDGACFPCFRCGATGQVGDGTAAEYHAAVSRWTMSDEREHVNLLGIRGWSHEKGAVPNLPNYFNDAIYAAWLDKDGSPHCEMFQATVDPGIFSQVYNVDGDAHLIDGVYQFKRGLHQGKYPALLQAEPVKVWRDKDKDGKQSASEMATLTGMFGINIHCSSAGEHVGNWSAGCQVIQGSTDSPAWRRFMSLVNADPRQTLPYRLIDASRLRALPT